MKIGCIYVIQKQERKTLLPVEVVVEGSLNGAIINLYVKQVYKNDSQEALDFNYIFPQEGSCLYDTTFYIGTEKINLGIQEKAAAEATFSEAHAEGHTAVIGKSLPNGLAEFTIGNVPSNAQCIVEVQSHSVSK